MMETGMVECPGNLLIVPNFGSLYIALHDKPKRLRVNGEAIVSAVIRYWLPRWRSSSWCG
jgi:hypothetical protein